MYRRPVGHYGFFHVAIDKLQLRPEDVFLEIGCGGGALLDMVLRTVQRACGIDHSPDMVVLAQQKNRRALFEGRVEIIEGDVEALPGQREPSPVLPVSKCCTSSSIRSGLWRSFAGCYSQMDGLCS